MTNNFELGPLVIANIYRNRWQIETFFYDKYFIMRSNVEDFCVTD